MTVNGGEGIRSDLFNDYADLVVLIPQMIVKFDAAGGAQQPARIAIYDECEEFKDRDHIS